MLCKLHTGGSVHLELLFLERSQPVQAGIGGSIDAVMWVGRDTEHPAVVTAAMCKVDKEGALPHGSKIIPRPISTGLGPRILQAAFEFPA